MAKTPIPVGVLFFLLAGMGLIAGVRVRALPPNDKQQASQTPQVYVPSTNMADGLQWVNADSNPTLRIPLGHSTWNWVS
jgi:hypothetical protein